MLRHNLPALLALSLMLSLTGCNGLPSSNASDSATLGPVRPDSEARTTWITQILAQDPLASQDRQPPPRQSNAQIVDALRQKRDLKLPDAYWEQWQRNLDTFDAETSRHKEAQRARYIATFSDQLKRVDDSTLQRLASAPDTLDAATRDAWKQRLIERYSRYIIDSEVGRDILDAHLRRMALMDRQFGVCDLDSHCWDRTPKP
ncbi:hypothetical protein DA83_01125 [Pseudomonas sp. 250J]|uniref:Lipoprotein n=1 Tax=Pseudomonas peradeniyensis TaxID=2745488 RepID=A0ABT2VGQ9_9PSED|nr:MULTISPECIES: hypothetical protein [Pseudomonas]KNX77542.1 hypothetical protein DA83_01125 [Pseudomonas sp. 250J]MCU7240936.1 hypothetical protein [Pseudomonas peradeniyensis]MCU7281860.1 hypothetical protein [Pseudomonas peradeniyensis]QZA56742.1 hypothetical protein K2O50_12110 [Pseudomonas sp. 2hn]